MTIHPSDMELEKAEAARQAIINEEEAVKEKARKEQEKMKRKNSKAGGISTTDADDRTLKEEEGD